MNYNILHGFHKTGKPFTFEKGRLEKAQKVVKKERPDILVLTEACYGGKNPFGIKMDYKKLFDFPYGHFCKWGDYEWGNAILSKYPINASSIKFGDRTALHSRICIHGEILFIDVIHPSPSLNEITKSQLLTKLLKRKQNPYIITGDFNSVSPKDNYSKDILISGFSNFMGEPKAKEYVTELLNVKCIKSLIDFGLVDSFKQKNNSLAYTVPTNLINVDKSTGLRIDYIFCSSDIEIHESGIIKTEFSELASDHYPIYAVISIK